MCRETQAKLSFQAKLKQVQMVRDSEEIGMIYKASKMPHGATRNPLGVYNVCVEVHRVERVIDMLKSTQAVKPACIKPLKNSEEVRLMSLLK